MGSYTNFIPWKITQFTSHRKLKKFHPVGNSQNPSHGKLQNFHPAGHSKNPYLMVYGFAVENRARWGMIVFADFWWRRWFHEIIFRFHEIILWFFGIFATGASDHFWRFLIIIGISFINRRTCNFTKKLVISRKTCDFTKNRDFTEK